MPEKHQKYLSVNGDSFREWASSVGPHAITVVNAILSAHKVEKQGYRACTSLITSLMKLADKYSLSRLEEACQRALNYTPNPSFKTVQTILKTGQDKMPASPNPVTKPNAETHSFVRGADYYGGRDHD